MIVVARSYMDLSESVLRLAELCSTRVKLSDNLLRCLLLAINYCLITEAA